MDEALIGFEQGASQNSLMCSVNIMYLFEFCSLPSPKHEDDFLFLFSR